MKEYNNTFVYLGRPTCQYCQQFVPVLHSIQQKLNIEVLYIDTTDFKNDTALQDLVKQYSLSGVPSFLYIHQPNSKLFDQDNNELENWIKEKL